jgi:hypothetical protein
MGGILALVETRKARGMKPTSSIVVSTELTSLSIRSARRIKRLVAAKLNMTKGVIKWKLK